MLRSGGSLLLSTPAHGRLTMLALALSARRIDEHFDPRADHLRFYTRRTLARLLEDFGFERIDVRAAGGLPGARRVLLASALRSRFSGRRAAVGRRLACAPAPRASGGRRSPGARARACGASACLRGAFLRARRAQRLDVGVLDRDRFGVARRRSPRAPPTRGSGRSPLPARCTAARGLRVRSYSPSVSHVCGLEGCRRTARCSVARASAGAPVACCTAESVNSACADSGSRETAVCAEPSAPCGSRASCASACCEASAERCGCHCAHAASSAPTTIAAATPRRSGPSALGVRRSRRSDRRAAGARGRRRSDRLAPAGEAASARR